MIIKEMPIEINKPYIGNTYVKQTNQPNKIKLAVKEYYGKYDLEALDELSKLLFCSREDTLAIVEQSFNFEIDRIKQLSLYLGISLEDIMFTEEEIQRIKEY